MKVFNLKLLREEILGLIRVQEPKTRTERTSRLIHCDNIVFFNIYGLDLMALLLKLRILLGTW